jgi:hypothetical protein
MGEMERLDRWRILGVEHKPEIITRPAVGQCCQQIRLLCSKRFRFSAFLPYTVLRSISCGSSPSVTPLASFPSDPKSSRSCRGCTGTFSPIRFDPIGKEGCPEK